MRMKKAGNTTPLGGAAGLGLDEVAFYPCVAKKRESYMNDSSNENGKTATLAA